MWTIQSRGFYPTSGISYVQPLSLPPPSKKTNKQKEYPKKFMESEK